mgnify:CR=1 FL=1
MIKTLRLALVCGLLTCTQITSWAQSEWPKAKPVTLLVAFAPGSSTDIVARSLTQKLNEITGGNFIVDNKGGAGGTVGAGVAANLMAQAVSDAIASHVFGVVPLVLATGAGAAARIRADRD